MKLTDKLKQKLDDHFNNPESVEKMRKWFSDRFDEENRLINDFKAKSFLNKIEYIKETIESDNGNNAFGIYLYAREYGRPIKEFTTQWTVEAYYIDELDTTIEMIWGQGTVYRIYSETHNFNKVVG